MKTAAGISLLIGVAALFFAFHGCVKRDPAEGTALKKSLRISGKEV